jgi:hypothetical protein
MKNCMNFCKHLTEYSSERNGSCEEGRYTHFFQMHFFRNSCFDVVKEKECYSYHFEISYSAIATTRRNNCAQRGWKFLLTSGYVKPYFCSSNVAFCCNTIFKHILNNNFCSALLVCSSSRSTRIQIYVLDNLSNIT